MERIPLSAEAQRHPRCSSSPLLQGLEALEPCLGEEATSKPSSGQPTRWSQSSPSMDLDEKKCANLGV